MNNPADNSASSPKDLPDLISQLVEQTEGDCVTIGELLKAFGQRSFGPMLLIPAIIAVAPTGAIPGMSIVTGTIICLVAMQILIGRDHVWLPDKVLSFEFSRDNLKSGVEKALPWAKKNRFTHTATTYGDD